MLDSTIWFDKDARDIFITALLMAHPHELKDAEAQIEVNSTKETGFVVPIGWYGFVDASGPGIAVRAGMDIERGMAALMRLGEAEQVSKSSAHDGRRMVRINGGYVILNYDHYRRKDHTTAERSARYRAKKQSNSSFKSNGKRASRVTGRGVTQAEAYSEAAHGEKNYKPKRSQMLPIDDPSLDG